MTAEPHIPVVVRVEMHSANGMPLPRRAPRYLPPAGPLPRHGDVIYLTSTSAWQVKRVVHEALNQREFCIHVVIEHIGSTHHREGAFSLTQ